MSPEHGENIAYREHRRRKTGGYLLPDFLHKGQWGKEARTGVHRMICVLDIKIKIK